MLNKLLDKIFQRKSLSSDDIVKASRNLFGNKCPICSNGLNDHSYSLLGQFEIKDGLSTFDDVRNRFNASDWAVLENAQEWKSESTFAQVFLLKCPQSSDMVAFLTASFAELNLDDKVLESKTVKENELKSFANECSWSKL